MKLFRKGVGSRAIAAAALLSAAVMALGVSPAAAAGTSGGNATLLKQDGVTPLSSGGSHTPFVVGLPPQAHCSGDTAHGGYNVYSYILPGATDPGTLTFDSSTGPNNNPNAYPLVDTSGSPYNAANTAPTTGQIYPVGPPTFDFAIFDTSILSPGIYNVGIECATSTGAGDVYFNAKINVVASATDPNGFTFTVVPGTPVPESAMAVALPLSAVAVVGIGGLVVVRRRRRVLDISA